MAIKFKKDLSGCIARANIELDGFPGHYYRVFLWKDQASMIANVIDDDAENAAAMCVHNKYYCKVADTGHPVSAVPKYMGEMHFIDPDWCLEYVAHECFHASNNICIVLCINPAVHIQYEEYAANIYGELVEAVYNWLWQTKPPSRDWNLWKRIKKVIFGKW